MPKYAPGGSMDKISRPNKRGNKNNITRIIQIALIVIVLFLVFGGNLSNEPIMIYKQSENTNYDTNEMQIDFTIKNTTLSFLFNPYYTIDLQDESGKTIYQETVKVCHILKPRESIDIHAVTPAIDSHIAKWTIGGHYQMFKPF